MLSQNIVATSQNQAGKIQRWVSDFLTSVHPRGYFQKYPCVAGKSHHHTMTVCKRWLGTDAAMCSEVYKSAEGGF